MAGRVEFNPVDAAMKPKVVESAVGILSVKESLALLKAAHARPQILPAIAIGLFAGVRDAEIKRLDWRNVNLETGYLEVSASIAKKGSRRLVEIRPALQEWLKLHPKLSGPVWPAGERGRILTEAARVAAELKVWPHNALRHSFASYALAKWQNANALALEMGNSVPIILEHYRELVLPTEAEAFWSLTPSKVLEESNVIQLPEQKTA
jgi:integrase